MSNANTRNTNNQPQSRGPKFVWVVRPSFTVGECRTYYSKEDALKDYGRPESEWVQFGDIWRIDRAPHWDPIDVSWELEKIEVRSLRPN